MRSGTPAGRLLQLGYRWVTIRSRVSRGIFGLPFCLTGESKMLLAVIHPSAFTDASPFRVNGSDEKLGSLKWAGRFVSATLPLNYQQLHLTFRPGCLKNDWALQDSHIFIRCGPVNIMVPVVTSQSCSNQFSGHPRVTFTLACVLFSTFSMQIIA